VDEIEYQQLSIQNKHLLEANKDLSKEIERLNNIIEEQDKELELEKKSRQLLTDDLANVCEMSLKKDNIIKEVREYIEYQLENLDFEEDTKAKMLGAMVLVLLDKENNNE
jgi:serine protease inhibitor